jgi:hypothetical protein
MLEKAERAVERHCLISGFAMAQGAEIEMPDADELLYEWEQALMSPPHSFSHEVDPEKYERMKVLGLVK